jgi:hypothetical protein
MTTDPGPSTEQVPIVAGTEPITEQVPTTTRAPKAPRRRRRRHPAAASRILAAGLATASTFGLVAVLGNSAHAGEVQQAVTVEPSGTAGVGVPVPTTAPPPVVVIRRSYVQVDGGTAPAAPPSAAAPASVPCSAPVTAAPRRTTPVTTSRSS